jgi:LysM repeat protein
MNFRRTILTVCLLLMIWPSIALAKEEPIIYTVKQGDTLWDISQRFIKDPYYWPNLWSNNPAIGNPHLIHPGQKLRIYDGRIEIIPIGEETSDVGAAVMTPEEVLMIPTYGGAQSFISTSEVESLGTLVDTVDNRLLISINDKVFLEMDDLAATQPGDVFELITMGPEVVHPTAPKTLGYQLADPIGFQTIQLGTVKVTKVTPTVAVATVTTALREIKRGSKVRPYNPVPDRIPRIFADSVVEGYIIGDDIGKIAMGQWEVVLIDMGIESGLQVGHEMDLYRQREATDQVDKNKKLTLPDIDLGDAIVLEVREGYAEALITRTTNLPIYRGDQIRTKLKSKTN